MLLHVIPSLQTGGAERTLAELVTARRNGPHPQAVVTLSDSDSEAAAAQIRAVDVPVYNLGLSSPVQYPIALARLTLLIRRLRPQVIQSWLYYADLIALQALVLSGRRAMTRLYWGVRCSDLDQSQYSRALRWTIALCARYSAQPDAVIANSMAGRAAHTRLGYQPRAFPVIWNGIDTEFFKPDPSARARLRHELAISEGTPVVIHIARVDPMKDHALLLDVAAQVPEARFLMVGRDTETLVAPDNVTALGRRGDVAGLYAAADFLLSTSAYGEGFPNVIAEAMACGLPVVATDVGDTARMIGDAGIIVPPRDVGTAVAGLKRLISEPQERRQDRARESRRRIERIFPVRGMVAAFDALHRQGTMVLS